MYFREKETKNIVEENRLIDSKELLKNPYETLIKLLILGPENSNNEKIIPNNIKLEKVKYENGIVRISFNEEYEKISEDEKNLIYESVYKTLIKLTEVLDVKIFSTVNENDENEILENRNVTCNVI